ncbi:MAG: U32 family peptidase [Burkholderiaceae bacterium]|uniref:Ubiquinone biosynthesis protein UbiU n=1 Tax=Roseateles toxinivorans TaxID=270368 RepID=A0A4R6QNS4_9BURK|nr:peptidase U32 family protein [Roseateles toxinivorans]MBT9455243.1 U32 family peptidase [Burkholderiaceae bacterium]TDP71238.1 putative protease [Roseateles toxinivorans]
MSAVRKPELVCPAGSLRALKLAIDAGADTVYLGLRNATNARNFAGLNFDDDQLREGVAYAHQRGRQVLMALNTFARADDVPTWHAAVDAAVALGADALIVADIAVMAYACRTHPQLRLHLSVQASATSHEAIAFYRRHYGIQRAVLPRVLTLSQVGHVLRNTDVEIEVFGFGSLCVMVEGRCALSSYATGQSPNNAGVCSPPSAVRWNDLPDGVEARLNGLLIDRYAKDEPRGYPTLCKGRFDVNGQRDYAIEEPTSLNTLAILPELIQMGVRAIKLEGRQRSPAYVEQVTRVWRQAIDAAAAAPERFRVEPGWTAALGHLAEGQQHTLGAYDRPWR